MSGINYCRLCVNIGLDFKSLYDENGQETEVYDLTAKYFDQSILNTDDAKQLSMICFQCWEHIWDFNNFQQAVLVAQANLDYIEHTEIPPVSGEQPGTNVLKDLQPQTSSAKEKNADCIYLSESEANAPPPTEEFINANHIVAIGSKGEDATNVDLTLDEDDMHQEEEFDPEEFINANHIVAIGANAEDATNLDLTLDEDDIHQEAFYDPVGLFIGGEFGNLSDCTPQTQMESIDLDSDSNSALCQFNISKTSETSSASETKSKSPNHGNHMKIYYSHANLIFVNKQLSTFFNHARKSCDEKFKKFAANRSFICFVCLEKCFGLNSLFMHSNSFHSTKPVHIICCKRPHKGIPSISKHLTSHYKSSILYQCEACGKTYTTKKYVNRHILRAHTGWIS